MKSFVRFASATALFLSAAALLALPELHASRAAQAAQHPAPSAEAVPAFHSAPPKDALPPTMEPSLFTDILIFNAYSVAGREKAILYQEPCYCHCDRSQGHGSLLDCFVSRHGSGCDICQKEAFFSYEQVHHGKTAAQIREAIIRGDWQKLDLVKYQKSYLPPSNKPIN